MCQLFTHYINHQHLALSLYKIDKKIPHNLEYHPPYFLIKLDFSHSTRIKQFEVLHLGSLYNDCAYFVAPEQKFLTLIPLYIFYGIALYYLWQIFSIFQPETCSSDLLEVEETQVETEEEETCMEVSAQSDIERQIAAVAAAHQGEVILSYDANTVTVALY